MIFGAQFNLPTLDYDQDEEVQKKRKIKDEEIILSKANLQGIQFLHNDPIVVILNIANYIVHHILIDNCSLFPREGESEA